MARQGQNAEAVLLVEAGLHLGQIWEREAYSVIDALVARAISGGVAGSFLSEAEAAKLEREARLAGPQGYGVARTHLEDYLRKQGRADLATQLRADWASWPARKEPIMAVTAAMMPRLYRGLHGDGAQVAVALGNLSLGLAALGVLVLLLSLVIGGWRESKAQAAPRGWGWPVVVAVVVAVAPAAAMTALSARLSEEQWEHLLILANVALGGALAAWLVGALVVAYLAARHDPAAGRITRVRRYLARLRAALLPAVAVALVLTVAALVPAQRHWEQRAGEIYQAMAQGEMRYGGLSGK